MPTGTMQMKVELHPAFVWDCDSCGRENFARGIVAELSAEEREEVCDEHGIDGEMIRQPTKVVCKSCGAKFETDERDE